MKRINFVAGMLGDTCRPGVQGIIARLKAQGNLGPEALVDSCLDLVGPMEVRPSTRQHLVEHVAQRGEMRWGTNEEDEASTERVGETLQLIASVREYQYC